MLIYYLIHWFCCYLTLFTDLNFLPIGLCRNKQNSLSLIMLHVRQCIHWPLVHMEESKL